MCVCVCAYVCTSMCVRVCVCVCVFMTAFDEAVFNGNLPVAKLMVIVTTSV
jgi:hypothetical protein